MESVLLDIARLRKRILFTNEKFERPFIILNVAASIDGKIALQKGKRMNISTNEDLRRVHMIRNEVDGILVGIGTILLDDPGLKVKGKYISGDVRDPVRIVLDSKGIITPKNRVLLGPTPTIIAIQEGGRNVLNWIDEPDFGYVSLVTVETEADGKLDLRSLFDALYSRNIRSILVEGGSTVISYLLRKGYFDIFTVFFRNFIIGGDGAPSIAGNPGARIPGEVIHLSKPEIKQLGDGFLFSYYPELEW